VIVTISEPRYLPFLGYLHRIDQSDQFILLDTVQYATHTFHEGAGCLECGDATTRSRYRVDGRSQRRYAGSQRAT